MKPNICKWLLSILLLQLNTLYDASSTRMDTGCGVKDSLELNVQEDTSLNITFFITTDDPITLQVSFVGLQKYLFNDLLILEHESGEIQSKRNGEATTYNINLKKNIPLGWNNMIITIQNNNLALGNFYTHDVSKNDINDISFAAKYFTDCAKSTPMWEITESYFVSIPLIGLSKFRIRLYSDEPFHPDLILNDMSIPLSYDDEELVYRKSIEPLPSGDYWIAFENVHNMISIFTQSANKTYILIMKANIKEALMNLKVRTHEGDFFIFLNPFLESDGTNITTTATSPTISTYLTTSITMELPHSPITTIVKPDVLLVSILVGVGVALILVISVIYFLWQRRRKKKAMSVDGLNSLDAAETEKMLDGKSHINIPVPQKDSELLDADLTRSSQLHLSNKEDNKNHDNV
ncbi:unnamed protein product, partial [Meganyctiphanes norvegica]